MLPDYNKAAEYLTARDTLNALAHLTERDQIYAAALSRFDSAIAAWCHEVDAYYISQDDTYDDSLARLVTGRKRTNIDRQPDWLPNPRW